MAQDNFDRCFEITVGHEGGFQANQGDPGNYTPDGRLCGTNFGISARSYPEIADRIVDLTLDEAKEIYRRDYWDKVRGDDLPAGVDLMTFDFAVHSGPARGVMSLQRAVDVADDGIVGPVTLAAAQRKTFDRWGFGKVISKMEHDRRQFIQNLSGYRTFGRGWEKRVTDVADWAYMMGPAY